MMNIIMYYNKIKVKVLLIKIGNRYNKLLKI